MQISEITKSIMEISVYRHECSLLSEKFLKIVLSLRDRVRKREHVCVFRYTIKGLQKTITFSFLDSVQFKLSKINSSCLKYLVYLKPQFSPSLRYRVFHSSVINIGLVTFTLCLCRIIRRQTVNGINQYQTSKVGY